MNYWISAERLQKKSNIREQNNKSMFVDTCVSVKCHREHQL